MDESIGSGHRLLRNMRNLIFRFAVEKLWDAYEIYQTLFEGIQNGPALSTIRKLVRWFTSPSSNAVDVAKYLTCDPLVGGRPSVYDDDFDQIVRSVYKLHPYASKKFVAVLVKEVAGDLYPTPSVSVISTSLKHVPRFSRSISALQDSTQILDFLELAQVFSTERLIFWDETSCSAVKFEARYGYAQTDHRAPLFHWLIGGEVCSVIAAYSAFGFLVWRIFFSPLNHHSVEQFLTVDLPVVLMPDSVVIGDNAATHRHPDTVETLDHVTNGGYLFTTPYAPELKPIERGFGCVWKEIQSRYQEIATGRISKITLVQESFYKYSILGSKGVDG